jgi:hypothetical protein
MHIKPVSLFFSVALGAALVSGGQAFGKNLNNNGNGNSNASTKSVEKSSNGNGNGNGNGNIASALGALNAGHAAPQAFANAAPNSRIGKIKAYYLASQTAALTDATVLQTAFEGSAPAAARDAYIDLQADPTNVTLQAAYDQAVLDAGLTTEQVSALEAAYTAWQDAVAADAEAASTLEAAANKTPVSDETKAALDGLIAGSIY